MNVLFSGPHYGGRACYIPLHSHEISCPRFASSPQAQFGSRNIRSLEALNSFIAAMLVWPQMNFSIGSGTLKAKRHTKSACIIIAPNRRGWSDSSLSTRLVRETQLDSPARSCMFSADSISQFPHPTRDVHKTLLARRDDFYAQPCFSPKSAQTILSASFHLARRRSSSSRRVSS